MTKRLMCAFLILGVTVSLSAQTNKSDKPTWWDKYQLIARSGTDPAPGATTSIAAGANVDVSNECGPQSETFITLNPAGPNTLAAGSNEIFRLPMRGYASADGGQTWSGVDLPLPPAIGANGIDFGSDPTLAFDTQGNVFYGYIVVFFGAGFGINGTAIAVARSTDGGRTYPASATALFSFEGGENHFNDKPMITHGATWAINRADDKRGPGRAIGASPAVGPNGEVYVAWNDYRANTIAFNRSFDGGATWGTAGVISGKVIPFDIAIPAESFRGALVYPACDTDRSTGPHRGRVYCSWMDLTGGGTTNIFLAYSDNNGASWSSPLAVGDPAAGVDRFNHWMSVDPVTGDVNVSYYDTRNDTTGERFMTDVFLAQSKDGGLTWQPDVRVTNVSSNEHDCDGVFPCQGINYGNQQGDYEGLVSYGGVSHPIWTDSRRQLDPATGCRRPFLMEEVFTATVQ